MSASATTLSSSRLVIILTLVPDKMGDEIFDNTENVENSQFVFEQEDYGRHAFQTLYELYKAGQLCDVILQVRLFMLQLMKKFYSLFTDKFRKE